MVGEPSILLQETKRLIFEHGDNGIPMGSATILCHGATFQTNTDDIWTIKAQRWKFSDFQRCAPQNIEMFTHSLSQKKEKEIRVDILKLMPEKRWWSLKTNKELLFRRNKTFQHTTAEQKLRRLYTIIRVDPFPSPKKQTLSCVKDAPVTECRSKQQLDISSEKMRVRWDRIE